MSEMFDANGYPFPPKPVPLDVAATLYYRERIKTLLKKHNAVMVAHYYTDPEIQALAVVWRIRWRWHALAARIRIRCC